MNLNPIDFNYIDGENIYPIQEYIDEEIYNKIENNNIYNIYSSNVRLNNNQKLDNSLYYLNSNLYLSNLNSFGEIRFKTNYNYPLDSSKAGTIIDYTGKLQVYHNYNILQPTFSAGYYDVEGEILSLKADGINTDGQITLLEAGAVYLQNEIDDIIVALNIVEGEVGALISQLTNSSTYEEFKNITESTTLPNLQANYGTAILNLKNQAQSVWTNTLIQGSAISFGIGLAGAGLSAVSSYIYYQQASNALFNNSNFTSNEKYTIYSNNTSNELLTYSNFDYSISNLGLFNGFINCNIITTQYINSINTNELKLNNLNISNIFVSSNVASNTSYGLSNNIFSSSNLNFNYTSNSLFSNLKPIYSSSNAVKDIILLDTPRVNKKSAFYCQTTNVIYPNFGNTPYYAYHIDLRNYTQTGYIQIGSQSGDTYRVFNIKCFFGSCYYQRLINGIPDIVDYTIYMSYKANSAGGDTKQGLNILATGIPQSYYLDTITPNRIFLLRNAFNDFNYISVVTTSSADVRVFIEDLLS